MIIGKLPCHDNSCESKIDLRAQYKVIAVYYRNFDILGLQK